MPHVHGMRRSREPSTRLVPCPQGSGAVSYGWPLSPNDASRRASGTWSGAGRIHTSPGAARICVRTETGRPPPGTEYDLAFGANEKLVCIYFRFIDLRFGSGHFEGRLLPESAGKDSTDFGRFVGFLC